jgi:hypothetical protein
LIICVYARLSMFKHFNHSINGACGKLVSISQTKLGKAGGTSSYLLANPITKEPKDTHEPRNWIRFDHCQSGTIRCWWFNMACLSHLMDQPCETIVELLYVKLCSTIIKLWFMLNCHVSLWRWSVWSCLIHPQLPCAAPGTCPERSQRSVAAAQVSLGDRNGDRTGGALGVQISWWEWL